MRNKNWFTDWSLSRISRIILCTLLAVLFTSLLLMFLKLDPLVPRTSHYEMKIPPIDIANIEWMKRIVEKDGPLSINDTYIIKEKGVQIEKWVTVFEYPGLHDLYYSLEASQKR